MYDLMAKDYSSHITRGVFMSVCDSAGFQIDNPVLGTKEDYGAISFIPIRCLVIRRNGHMDHIDNVLFFRHTDRGWRLINFPFLQPELSSFLAVPEWFIHG
jgi:hypothetical protein